MSSYPQADRPGTTGPSSPLVDSPDPYPARTPCLFDGCRLSVEEHHRLTRGLSAENAALRLRLNQPDTLDLSDVSTADLLAEVALRIDTKGSDHA